MINVTQTFLPPEEEYFSYLRKAWNSKWITNNGQLLVELEKRLRHFLNVPNVLYCTNGTIALQLALKVLNITGEVITTPFSYVATTNAILWENCTPVFVDINADDFCIDADKIEQAITPRTQAILATHVYGLPCAVEKIRDIANKHNLKVIYDGAHAFGVNYKGRSLLSYGDITTCSFHATKVFHTVEGGAVICSDELKEKLHILRSFGHREDNYYMPGINAKNSEFHAAMGLALLPYIKTLIAERKRVFDYYSINLNGVGMKKFSVPDDLSWNYCYYPVIFDDENQLLKMQAGLLENEINPRRYFYPSLNTLHYVSGQCMPVSEDIAKRVLCLPMYPALAEEELERICGVVNKVAVEMKCLHFA